MSAQHTVWYGFMVVGDTMLWVVGHPDVNNVGDWTFSQRRSEAIPLDEYWRNAFSAAEHRAGRNARFETR